MRTLLPLVISLLISSFHISSSATKLNSDSPEFKQMKAMGYEIHPKSDELKETSVFTNGSSLINISKTEHRVAIWRAFTRRKLSTEEETVLLEEVNEMNKKGQYQVNIKDTSINFVVYLFGTYDRKNFAQAVREMENSEHFYSDKIYNLIK